MKLLIVTSFRPFPVDGASTSARALVKSLRQAGIDCTVCTTDFGWPAHYQTKKKEMGINVFHALFSLVIEFSPTMIVFFIKQISKYDLVHFRSYLSFGTLFGMVVACIKRKKYVVSPVGDIIPLWKERKKMSKGIYKYILFHFFLKILIKRAACIVCASDLEQNRLTVALRSNSLVLNIIPNGIDTDVYTKSISRDILMEKYGIPISIKFVLFIGRITYIKALDFLLDVWNIVISKYNDNLILVISGGEVASTNYTAFINDRILKLRKPQSVIMTGKVTGKEKLSFLQHAESLVLPSYKESFGNVVLESLISGTPVIASTGTPWQMLELERLGRWLPHNKELWAHAINEMSFPSKIKKTEFSNRSIKWVVENFSWDTIANRYIEIYKKCLVGLYNYENVAAK